jgi:2-keto-4-pentenoate hydratase/2-oxohepta-3-ene-1,7-dioic acid hydratase in catechol pathway
MRFVRFLVENALPRYGWLLENHIGLIEGNIFNEFRRMEPEFSINDVRLLAPVIPSKIICVGRNYLAHVKEHQADVPSVPLLFLKPPSSVINPNESIVIPPQSQQVEHEAELVVVIGKKGRWIRPENVHEHILGYTIGNDVTARDLQRQDDQWTRAKGFDSFCPIGPWIETDFDPAHAMISCYVNGEMRQMASTHEMIFNITQLMAFASSIMTLEPGDLIFTGTPSGVTPLQAGDQVRITIEGIGSLDNPVGKAEF